MAGRYKSMREFQFAVTEEAQDRLDMMTPAERAKADLKKVSDQVQRDMASRKPEAAKPAAKPRTPKKRGT